VATNSRYKSRGRASVLECGSPLLLSTANGISRFEPLNLGSRQEPSRGRSSRNTFVAALEAGARDNLMTQWQNPMHRN